MPCPLVAFILVGGGGKIKKQAKVYIIHQVVISALKKNEEE